MNKGLDTLLHTGLGIILPLTMGAVKLNREYNKEKRLLSEKKSDKTIIAAVAADLITYGAVYAAFNWDIPEVVARYDDKGFLKGHYFINHEIITLRDSLPYAAALLRGLYAGMARMKYHAQRERNAILRNTPEKVRRII